MLREGRQRQRYDDVPRDHRSARGSGRACAERGKMNFGSEELDGRGDQWHQGGWRQRECGVGKKLHEGVDGNGDGTTEKIEDW